MWLCRSHVQLNFAGRSGDVIRFRSSVESKARGKMELKKGRRTEEDQRDRSASSTAMEEGIVYQTHSVSGNERKTRLAQPTDGPTDRVKGRAAKKLAAIAQLIGTCMCLCSLPTVHWPGVYACTYIACTAIP